MNTLTAQSSAQVVSGYLATIQSLPEEHRLNALAEILAVTVDTEIRAPLLREFNYLSEREPNV